MQNVFRFRNDLIDSYSSFSRSFTKIDASDIADEVEKAYERGRYWPEPLIQINPNYQRAITVEQLVKEGLLHPGCETLFKAGNLQAPEQTQQVSNRHLRGLGHRDNFGYFLRIEGYAVIDIASADESMTLQIKARPPPWAASPEGWAQLLLLPHGCVHPA